MQHDALTRRSVLGAPQFQDTAISAIARYYRTFAFFLFIFATTLISSITLANPGDSYESLKLNQASKVTSTWSHARILYDANRSLSVDQAIAALPKFEKPNTPYSTLGVRPEAAWLHIPIETALNAPRYWVADIDYPPLNYVDMFLLRDGKVVLKAELGSLREFASRPLLARSHAMPVALDPASRYDLLVRVDTRGAMILPFTIESPASFHSTGLFEQMLQGLLIGIALCLVFYSLGQYASTRERLFGKYALLVFGSMVFTLLQLGIGAQYVWRDVFWIERHIAGISSMIAIGGTFLFLEEALREEDRTSQNRSWFELIMKRRRGARGCDRGAARTRRDFVARDVGHRHRNGAAAVDDCHAEDDPASAARQSRGLVSPARVHDLHGLGGHYHRRDSRQDAG